VPFAFGNCGDLLLTASKSSFRKKEGDTVLKFE
jgi:hypothetical protein